MPEFILVAASNGIKFNKSALRINSDVEIVCESGAKIRHHRNEFSLIALLRKAINMQPTKAIIVFSDILLNSLGLAEHQVGNTKHEMNKMTADQVMKELVFLVDLCARETEVPLFFMTGSRRCDVDSDTVKLEHHPDGCFPHCQKSAAQKLTRALDEWWKAGKLNFRFFRAHALEGNNAFELDTYGRRSCSHLKPSFFKKSVEAAISSFLCSGEPKKNRKGKGAKRRAAASFFGNQQKKLRASSPSTTEQREGQTSIEF